MSDEMSNWFTIEKIDETTFAISEYGHWEEVHSYLLIGDTKALLIDTGLGIGNIKEEAEKLTALPIKVVTTHAHWDHIGGHGLFHDIAVHKEDAHWLMKGLPIPEQVIKSNVIKDLNTGLTPKEFNIHNYQVFKGNPSEILKDGDTFDLGKRSIRVIHTPGHSPGHICLWEEERGYLFTGDLIYKGTLYAFYPSTNPLQFKQSVDKISSLEVVKILPAHHALDIKPDFIQKVKAGFETIEKLGKLRQGSGIFAFEEFMIQI